MTKERENGENQPENEATTLERISVTGTHAESVGFGRGIPKYVRIFFSDGGRNPRRKRWGDKMAPTVASGSERTAMERFGGGGMALLPWTKQMLTVLWEQLRFLVQVIYYTFISGKNKAM